MPKSRSGNTLIELVPLRHTGQHTAPLRAGRGGGVVVVVVMGAVERERRVGWEVRAKRGSRWREGARIGAVKGMGR